MSIKFQDKLIQQINTFTIDSFPHTVLIKGEKGSGKHLICNYIAEQLQLPVQDITDTITLDTINDITLSTQLTIYTIDISKVTEKEQNVILKLVEEPVSSVYIVLLCEQTNYVLPTVLGRCYVFTIQSYTKEQLASFSSNEQIIALSSTPGDVITLEAMGNDLSKMSNLCHQMFNSIGNASYANILILVNKLAFKNEQDLFDVYYFIKMLLYTNLELCKQYNDARLQTTYNLTKELFTNIQIPNINKQHLYENYLLSMKRVLQK